MAERPTFPYDVFLSHNSADKPRVRKLAERLQAAGLRVWFDEWIIKPGDDIYLAVERGLEASRVQVLCLSPTALGSDWVTLERSTVLFRDPTNAGRRFIPLLLADCDLPDTLRRYKYVDCRDDSRSAFKALLTACRTSEVRNDSATGPIVIGVTDDMPGEFVFGSLRSALHAAFDASLVADQTRDVGNGPTTRPIAIDVTDGMPDFPISKGLPRGFRLRYLLPGHEEVITRLSWAPDGVRLASSGQDGAIRVWGTETGKLLLEMPGVHGIAWSPAWSQDGRTIACGYGDCAIRLWDSATGAICQTLHGHRVGPFSHRAPTMARSNYGAAKPANASRRSSGIRGVSTPSRGIRVNQF